MIEAIELIVNVPTFASHSESWRNTNCVRSSVPMKMFVPLELRGLSTLLLLNVVPNWVLRFNRFTLFSKRNPKQRES